VIVEDGNSTAFRPHKNERGGKKQPEEDDDGA